MKNKVLAVLVCFIVIVFDILFLTMDTRVFSENENRYLTLFPKFKISNVLDGKYMNNLTEYVKDQFPYRDFLMGIKTKIDKLMLKTEINDVYLGKENYLIDKYTELKNKNKIINIFNNFNNNTEIDMYLALVPTSISVNDNKLPIFSVNDNQLNDIDYIYKGLNFTAISLYDTLKINNIKSDMFYHLDHHWTSDGAYVAYKSIINKLGFNYIDKSAFDIKVVSDKFYGTLYSKTSDYDRKPDSIKLYFYNNDLDVYYADKNINSKSLYDYSFLTLKDKYSVFLGGNHSLTIITNNDIVTEDELIVVKDSYANSLIPFLINHYKKIHVIDPRYYNKCISDYIKENPNIVSGLILYNINTIENDLGIYTIR